MIKPPAVRDVETQRHDADASPDHGRSTDVDNAADPRVWVLRVHRRATLCQSHAVVQVDWNDGLALTSCGLGLQPDEIADVPSGGCMPCVLCVAATPRPPEAQT